MMKETRSIIYQLVVLVVILGLGGCEGPFAGATKGKIKVSAATQWTDSGIDVRKGQEITVQAAGDVYVNEKIHSGPTASMT